MRATTTVPLWSYVTTRGPLMNGFEFVLVSAECYKSDKNRKEEYPDYC
jgi:hypothetical protein